MKTIRNLNKYIMDPVCKIIIFCSIKRSAVTILFIDKTRGCLVSLSPYVAMTVTQDYLHFELIC